MVAAHAPLLSKSKLLAARQCRRRLHLELHRPELAVIGKETQAALDTGNAVGRVAQSIYGTENSVLVAGNGGLERALRQTALLLRAATPAPVFEAAFEYGGVLVRVDVLLPTGAGWRLVEVKASTRLEPEHVADCAIQLWVVEGAGCPLAGVSVAHVDSQFVYPGDDAYGGLLREEDVEADARRLLPLVPEWASDARAAATGPEPRVAVGAQCFKPYACPFVGHCWPGDVEHPLLELPRAAKGRLGEFVARGYRDLREVPPGELTEAQRRVQRVTRSGVAESDPAIGRYLRSLEFPRYYLDFESVGPAIPVFPGTGPYQALPFQWSCHYESGPGRLEHAEFLDLTAAPPFRRLAESLVRALGRVGPIVVYSSYERTMLDRLARLFADLGPALAALAGRLVDLRPIIEQGYYHPSMRGSWSLKSVLPAVLPDMNYGKLDGIQEGMDASSGYLEAIAPGTTPERRQALDAQLRAYCRFDTEALYRLVQVFAAR
ncbi:MAG: DUF2779 domain-containing protein [Gammaproteobacteria bacterium]|nr:DUF2779 domain-containing protein [Gammaproteobacteria bacterium]MDH4253635.1 DUF2779 domain-containing protein [Gammaproteobacteria bacterium]MDH5309751.1 DUF2779 domain-containing protein [Gammaproteobacteria bacterium]